ncbi:MAG: DEAD/DEAH box helicase [Candidatus Omnitrophica bacterium]|nr:DEAD/DEAH box helicase [Candidatus Omnitrophota bacterium]
MSQELVTVVLPNGTIQLEWTDSQDKINKSTLILQEGIFKRFQKDFSSCLLFLGFCDETVPLSISLGFLRNFAHLFTQKLSHTPNLEQIRDKIAISLEKNEIINILHKSPFMIGAEYLNEDILEALWLQLNIQFQQEIKKYKGSVENFIKEHSSNIHLVGRVYFHLVENKKSEEFPFAFLSTYSTSLNKQGKLRHLPLKYALEEYGDDNLKLLDLLSTVHLAAKESHLISRILDSGDIFHPLAWSSKEAFQFLKEITLYENCGILCRIPNWWKGSGSSLKVNITIGNSSPSRLGIDAVLNFNAQLLLGDSVISEEDARKILAESEGLAYIKGRWVEVDSQRLTHVINAFEQAKRAEAKGLTMKEAMRIQMGAKEIFGDSSQNDFLDISNGEWLSSVIEKLRQPEMIKSICPDRDFKAVLRGYQQNGLNWLYFLHSLQFGACLADDMGLGKTIQVLAFLTLIKKKDIGSNSLLIIPASLLANWQNEIHRFAPSLKYFIAHPGVNPQSREILTKNKVIGKYDLVITTYAMLQKYESLRSTEWCYVVLDEAQAIKNPGTKQTKAVKQLKSYNRIILTGTPIENRLSDLWSLYDFINPGLLGNIKEFSDYVKGLNSDPNQYSRLKDVISPYLLRRLKTDRSIISDLPDKIEMKTYSNLSKKQIILYKELVDDISETLEQSEGIQRKGIILSSLMKFKQICNHPGQYLDNKDYSEQDSGKFWRLREICEIIFEKREKVLIFTQFKEITSALGDFLKTIFNHEGLILHGSIPVSKRKKIIERFQSKEYVPFFILSVKAGGVGLNLTEANHVIHFDRWWNPAVENQATDRAFRIGQKKKVIVHKFITKGTVEEKIDSMLEEKAALSRNVIQSSKENWITEMDNNKILDLFKLNL